MNFKPQPLTIAQAASLLLTGATLMVKDFDDDDDYCLKPFYAFNLSMLEAREPISKGELENYLTQYEAIEHWHFN